MRYRPIGREGQAISAVSLAVGDEPKGEAARKKLIYAALEAGVNAFELRSADLAVARTLGETLQAVERRLVLVSLLLPGAELTADTLIDAIEAPLLHGRLGKLDAVIVEDAGEAVATLAPAFRAAREAERIGFVGVKGVGADLAFRRGFDLLAASYHLRSGWADRNRMKSAVGSGATVIGHGFLPPAESPAEGKAPAKVGLFGFGKKPTPLEKTHAYAFLRSTPGWEMDEICLAYALHEPALATVVVEAQTAQDIERLAAVPERELPNGLPAQIEMARVAADG